MRSPLANQATEHDSGSGSASSGVSLAALAAGTTLDERYRLDREVARTEAGVVFEATDVTLNRRVAVEVASGAAQHQLHKGGGLAAFLSG